MKISNPTYETVQLRTDTITAPLKAGTPVSKSGQIANNELAIGIVPQTYADLTNVESINILVAGDVQLAEAEALYGQSINVNAIKALAGINFYDDNGKVIVITPTELPAVTNTDNGKLLGVDNGAWGKVSAPTGLPTVTNADNGKLLGVVNGAWDKVDAPLGSFVIEISDYATVTTPKADIEAAIQDGIPLFIRRGGVIRPAAYTNNSGTEQILSNYYEYSNDDESVYFSYWSVLLDSSATFSSAEYGSLTFGNAEPEPGPDSEW